jgi:methylmalonyl-CoA mutase N-terminal domain/subunit
MGDYISEGQGFFNTAGRFLNAAGMMVGINDYRQDEDIQKILERRSAARVSADPEQIAKKKAEEAAVKQKEAADAQIAAQKEVDKMPASFKGPEGFSNVVGVGANPVLEAMASQLEEAKKTNDLLSQLVTSGGGRTSSWLDAPTGNPHVDGYGDQM